MEATAVVMGAVEMVEAAMAAVAMGAATEV